MKYIILSFIMVLFFLGCSEDMAVLEEEPKAIAIETFLNTKEEIEGTIFSIYHQLKRNQGFGRYLHTIPESMADYAVGRGSFSYPSSYIGLDATNSNRVQDTWAILYRAISFANRIIKNAPKASDATQDEIIPLVAEARFLRAFAYYKLVQNWGAVPLVTEENMSEFSQPRIPVATIYNFIVDDLKYAETNLPESQSMMGRPQKTTAKTVLTEIYLVMEEWSNARDKALEVINSNKYSLIEVTKPDDFYNIYGHEVNGTSEEIFYLKYSRIETALFPYMLHSPKVSYLNYHGAYGIYSDSVENKVIREWDPNDLRKKFNLYNAPDIGFAETTVLCKKFIDPGSTGNNGSNDMPVYRYADLLLFYAEAECMANNGPTADGMEKLNMVHRRAYGYNPDISSVVDFDISNFNKDTFIDLLLKERCYETMFEGKRYNDLRRMGKFEEVIYDAKGIEVSVAALLWPIPNQEIQYNESIGEEDQNPGY